MRQFCPYLWSGTLKGLRCPNCDCSDGPDIAAAQAIEARRAETAPQAPSSDESVVRQDAPDLPQSTPSQEQE